MSEDPSWLRLEQRLLGELSELEAAELDRLAPGRLAALRGDERSPPPLDLSREDSGLGLPDDEAEVVSLFRPAVIGPAAIGLLALAAAALIAVAIPGGSDGGYPAARTTWKGGELALDIDRLRGAEISEHATGFAEGDRLRVRLTCAPGLRDWDLVVYQADGVSFPLEPGAPLRCGNRAVLPGAFTLDGGAAWVCAVLDPPGRAALEEGVPEEGGVCVRLIPE